MTEGLDDACACKQQKSVNPCGRGHDLLPAWLRAVHPCPVASIPVAVMDEAAVHDSEHQVEVAVA